MPVFNGGPYFELALQSALSQTFENTEVVVVNDGSTDGGRTAAIARKYRDKVKYVEQDNKGVAGALNTAIEHMTGDILTWLSHDDLFLPFKTATQVDCYRRMGRRDAILFSDWTFIDSDGGTIHDVAHDHARLTQAPMLAMLIPCINGCTIFVPRHILEEMGPFEEKYRYTQDYHLWNRILGKYEFFHLPQKLIKYRIHPGQDSNRPAAAAEGDELWIRIIDDRSEAERVQMFGSSKRFYDRMGTYFAASPYQRASAYALELARTCVEDTLVSVLVPVGHESDEDLRGTVLSALGQTHRKLEILLVDTGGAGAERLAGLAALDPRVRWTQDEGSPAGRLDRALWAAEGSYLASVRPGSRLFPHKVERQLRAMQDAGELASHTAFLGSASRHDGRASFPAATIAASVSPGSSDAPPLESETLMIHTSLVSEGLEWPWAGVHAGTDDRLRSLSRRHSILGVDEVLSLVHHL